MPIELFLAAVICLPTIGAFVAWFFKHTNTTVNSDTLPISAWGAYYNLPEAKTGAVRVPDAPEHEEIESSSHIHTIGVHP